MTERGGTQAHAKPRTRSHPRTSAHATLWRRLDAAGHDACRLDRMGGGWRLRGTAVCHEGGAPMALDYRVTCDRKWRTRDGVVRGWLGERTIALTIARTHDGRWLLNDEVVDGLDDCFDLDFGFTPATNVLQLHRIALAVGAAADVPVAWLDVVAGTLERLEQRYHRVTEHEYAYEAVRFEYREVLELGANGFVRRYPRLWEAE